MDTSATHELAMTQGPEPQPSPPPSPADAPGVDSDDWLDIELSSPTSAARGRLALFVEGAIERALEARLAPPPVHGGAPGLAESLDEQLGRARLSGAIGLVLRFASLRCIATRDGSLDTADSRTIRDLLAFAQDRPVHLYFHPEDRALGVYEAPRTLGSVVEADAQEGGSASFPPAGAPWVVRSGSWNKANGTTDASRGSVPDASEVTTALLAELERSAEEHEQQLRESARALASDLDSTDWLHETLIQLSTPPPEVVESCESPTFETVDFDTLAPPRTAAELTPACVDDFVADDEGFAPPDETDVESEDAAKADGNDGAEPHEAEQGAEPGTRSEDESETGTEAEAVAAQGDVDDPPAAEAFADQNDLDDPSVAEGEDDPAIVTASAENAESHDRGTEEGPPAAVREAAPVDPELAARAIAWERELAASHGPKPLSVIERQFSTAYVPLRNASRQGAAGPSARAVLDEWATSFSKSYTDAFEVLRYRGKRPTMVLDIPDMAVRIARLHGARSTQLVLVDGLRFDVGLMVDTRLRTLVGGRAACAERFLLWSALPTTTATQVELIGRGPMGLRDPAGLEDEDMLVAHGKKAATMRRLRTGQRELLKLDIVEARLDEPGGRLDERLAPIADEVADRLAAHFEGVPDRTLVVVFGDHGFRFEEGSHEATQGGASPEEVLVPAFAWVVGPIH